MSALTSLLVRDQIVPVRTIEEALQRQVISGGDLESVLLGMLAVPENVMNAYRAALYGLLPATRDEVMKVPRETLRAVPREVAMQYKLVPLRSEDRTVVVAVTAPLSIEDEQQLAFLLGVEIVYRIVSEVRMAAALSHHYGIEAPPRMRRLAEKLRQQDAGRVPYVAPPEDARVDGKTKDLQSKAGAQIDWDDDEDAPTPVFEGKPTQKMGTFAAAPDTERPPPPSPDDVVAALGGADLEPADSPRPTERPPSMPAPVEPAPARAPSAAPAKAVRPDIARRLRGPLTAKAGVEMLREAEGRDEILEIFFVFARQFFDYTALFVVHEDMAEGRDSHGGADSESIRLIAVPLDVPGTFERAKEQKTPIVGRLDRDEIDGIVARDLGRGDAQPSVVAPVALRGRVVLMIYGDRGGEAFELSDLPELVGFLPRVADAFLALLLKKKRKGYAAAAATEDRPNLKAAATRLSAGAIASEPTVDKGGYRPSKEPPAPTPAPTPEPVAAPIEPAADPEPAAGRDGENPLGVLGVPRSAPPPPGEGPQDFQLRKATRPDGQAAIAQQRSRSATKDEAPPARPAEDAEPEVVIEYDDEAQESDYDSDDYDSDDYDSDDYDSDDYDEEAPSRPGGEEALPQFARSQADRPLDGGYQQAGGATDVLGGTPAPSRRDSPTGGTGGKSGKSSKKKKKKKRKPKAPEASGGRRADPRSDGGAPASVEVVRVPDVEVAVGGEPVEVSEPRRTVPHPAPNMPSVIVDMGDTVEVLVDDLIKCGPDDETAAVGSLLSLGEAALPVLAQRFPGPLWFDRQRPHRRLPRGRDVSAISRAFVAFQEQAIPYVMSLTQAGDPEVRFYGTLLAAELVSKELLVPVGERLFDDDPGTQLLAVDVLRRFSQFPKEMEEFMKGVRVEARVDRQDVERRRIAVRALGLLRDVKSVELLTDLLAAKNALLAEQAHRALVVLTRQDFGDSQRRWAQWFEKNANRHRVEWLIEGLVHPDESIRAAAGDELQVLSQEYYGYHPRLPKRDREVAHKRYQKWWDTEGHKRFQAS